MQDAIILYENGKAVGGEGHPTDADDITFNNTGTDIVANKVGSAIKEVNAKSAKSADLTPISETGSTASQAISAGTYFYLDGTLVKAKTAIASGATFTLNTNYEVVTAGALNKIAIKYADYTASSASTGTGGYTAIANLNNFGITATGKTFLGISIVSIGTVGDAFTFTLPQSNGNIYLYSSASKNFTNVNMRLYWIEE